MTTPTAPTPAPFAVFAYDFAWDDLTLAMYRIVGGPRDGSDVGAETLRQLGIAVPERTVAA